jgi:hypothetical protein
MKQSLLLVAFLGSFIFVSAQQAVKVTYETAEIGSNGGATAMWSGGTVEVIANAYKTGNPSDKVLHCNNTNYLPVYFENIALPAGAETMYSMIRVKYLMIGGEDMNYPSLDIYSSPNNYTAGETEKIGTIGWQALWGTAEVGIWKTIEFPLSTSILKPVPEGKLILKLIKSKCEYLIDDIELVPVPASSDIFTVADFEGKALNDVLSMRRWSTTDATATVVASPTDAQNKVAHVVCTNWNSAVRTNVVLPSGKELAHYDNLSFDIYLNNIEGTDNVWKNIEVYAGDTKVIEKQSEGVANAWETKSYPIENLAGGNTFTLDVGLNTNNGNYFFDNIKLKLKSLGTGIEQPASDALFIYSTSDAFVFSMPVDEFTLYTVNGAVITNGSKVSSIASNELAKGVYILKAFVQGQTYTTKIIK